MNISSFAATSVQTSALTLQAQPAASKPQTDVTAAGTQRLGIVPPQNPVSEKGIIIVGGTIAAGTSGYKVVVQETDESVLQIDGGDRSTTPDALGVSAPQITVPPAL